MAVLLFRRLSFNTQPPEGGWIVPEGSVVIVDVSTHSRLKAAGRPLLEGLVSGGRFNTQPPEGGWGTGKTFYVGSRSFNTQPPEGGWAAIITKPRTMRSFNTQPPEGGWLNLRASNPSIWQFQHTAA